MNEEQKQENAVVNGWQLEAIGEPSEAGRYVQEIILASWNAGGFFQALNEGRNKAVQSAIIVKTILAMAKAGASEETIIEKMKEAPYEIVNNSAWGKTLNTNLHWKKDGKYVTFAERFPTRSGTSKKPDLSLVF